MNIPLSLCRSRFSCRSDLLFRLNKQWSQIVPTRRTMATNRETGPSTLSQSLDTKDRSAPRDHVGPFQLGVSQAQLRSGERVKNWSELSTGGKVMRTTARTTNLTVILLGAGLSALLIYSLTSELFSKNSPTVLYGDACERIKSSPRVAKYLNGPLTFHNNPPSAVRPRHRNRHVTSQIMVDAHGHEHMIMTFYVQGRPPGSTAPPSESSYTDLASEWVQATFATLSELTLDESIVWIKEKGEVLKDRSRRAFKYLSGAPVPPPVLPEVPASGVSNSKTDQTSTWSFAGMFSSLKASKGNSVDAPPKPDGRILTDGEVHADFIKNNEGYFVPRYVLIDMPSSRDRNPVRVFVERGPGVRENEPVMRWKS